MSRQWGVRRILSRDWMTLDPASPQHLPRIRRHQSSGWAARDFYDRTTGLDHGDTRQKKENNCAQFALTFGDSRLEVELSDRPSKQKKADDYSGNTKINLELHDVSHANRRLRIKMKAGHLGNDLRAATIYRLVRPEDSWNQSDQPLPERLAFQVLRLAAFTAS